MARMTKISKEQHFIIKTHILGCLDMAHSAVENAKSQVAIVDDKRTTKLLQYWENVHSGLKWSLQQANYRYNGD